MTLEEAVAEILTNFKSGECFDSHTVINALLTKPDYHLAYLQEYVPNTSVAQHHISIAHLIKATNAAKAIGNAKTPTIYGDLSVNKLWQKM